MVVTVVGCSGGASCGGFAEHGGGCCPLTCRASAGLPAPPLQAASTRTADTGSTETIRRQVRQVRTGDWVPAAADAPRRDDILIMTLSWTETTLLPDAEAMRRGSSCPRVRIRACAGMGHLHLACRPAGTLIGERWHRLAGGARIRISPVRSVQQLPRRPGGRPRTRLPEPAAARPAQRPLVRQPRRALP